MESPNWGLTPICFDPYLLRTGGGPLLALMTYLIVALIAGGCASPLRSIRGDKTYSGKITDAHLSVENARVPANKVVIVSRWGARKVTAEHQTKVIAKTGDAIQEIHVLAPERLARALGSNGVRVTERKDPSAARLVITPIHVDSVTHEAVDTYDIWYRAVLYEGGTNRDVWSGEVKMFVFPTEYNHVGVFPNYLDDFCSRIAEQLANAELLPR